MATSKSGRKGYAVVRISVGPTNQDPLDVLDLGRRQVDHCGRPGIVAKRGQTDEHYEEKGYLRFPFQNPSLARRVVKRIERLGEPALRARLLTNPNPFPR